MADRFSFFLPTILSMVVCTAITIQPALAQDQIMEKWPCDQVYTKALPLGSIWQGPSLNQAAQIWWEDSTLFNVIEEFKDPTLSEEEITTIITTYADSVGNDIRQDRLIHLMAGAHQRFSEGRSLQLTGIINFVKRQETITNKISEKARQLRDLRKENVAIDDQKYREIEAEMEWNTRVYDERQRLTFYVCEQPILLVQRLGHVARVVGKLLGN